jgi:hypothetical protein
VIKIMGVSDNCAQVSACEDELRRHFADQLVIRLGTRVIGSGESLRSEVMNTGKWSRVVTP